MRLSIRRALCGAAGAVLAAGVLVGVPGVANAAVTPGWEPDSNALGNITFYDAAGKVITGGSLTSSPAAAYAAASGPGTAGDTKAIMYMYLPVQGVAPASWSGDTLTASTVFPNTSAPATVKNLTVPVASGADGDLRIADVVDEFPNTSAVDGYKGLYELRLFSAPKGVGGQYYRADIQVDSTAGTWTVVYPVGGPATTTTSLAASPASPQKVGTAVTLSATVLPAAAGAVEFFDGTTDLGAGTYTASTGVATLSVTPTAGDHSYTAKFTPSDATAYNGSTSAALPFTVNALTATSTTLSVSPASGTTGDASGNLTVTLTAGVAPTGLDGSLHFFDGSTDLGVADSYTASTGVGVKSAVLNAAASPHKLTATFVPTNGNYSQSTSAVQDYTVVGQNSGTAQITVQANNSTEPYAGNLALQVTSGATAKLTQVDPTSDAGHPALASDSTGHRHAWVFTGGLTGVSVQDTRPTEPGWTVTGQSTSFANGAITVPAAYLGWTPAVATGGDAEGTVTAGPSIASALASTSSSGLSAPAKLASVATGSGLGTANLSSGLELRIPDTSPTGTYASTLTLTLVSP